MLRRPLRSNSSNVGDDSITDAAGVHANPSSPSSCASRTDGTGIPSAPESGGHQKKYSSNSRSTITAQHRDDDEYKKQQRDRLLRRRRQPGGDPKRLLLQTLLCLPCTGLLFLYAVFFTQSMWQTTTSPTGPVVNVHSNVNIATNSKHDGSSDLVKDLPPPEIPTQQHHTTSTSTSTSSCAVTIVTAYFPVRSKYSQETYQEWMDTMLSLQDCMVIYTTPEFKPTLYELRRRHENKNYDTVNRTVIIDMELEDLPLAKQYDTMFWQSQLDQDPEKRLHKAYELFWIWLSKPWFVKDSVVAKKNPFRSEYFVWVDIGCFRSRAAAQQYGGVQLVPPEHARDVIPPNRMLFLAHQQPNPPPKNNVWWTDKLSQKQHFYHSGTIMAGRKETWERFYEAYQTTLRGLVDRRLFVGDDQPVAQCTCLQHPTLCAYITHDQVKRDNHYFGLRYALHHGGMYKYWYPPELVVPQDDDDDKTTNKETVAAETNKKEQPSSMLSSKSPTTTTVPEPTIVTFSNGTKALSTAPNTVVTAYFSMPSKFPSKEYNNWMKHMLSLTDAMVIFTSPNLVNQMKTLRSHAPQTTVIVAMELEHVPLALQYDVSFWQGQLQMDPERRIHQSYQLFWVWLSKSWFVTEAIRYDFFRSDVYMWSDIGCFRRANYDGKQMIRHRDIVPKHSILQMAHHAPNPPPDNIIWWNDKYKQKQHFYHSGSQAVGYGETWVQFHQAFMATVEGFVERHMFVGEDQAVMQSTCLREPDLCAYVPFDQVVPRDNHYWGLRYVLHHGGNYRLWQPPTANSE